MTHVLYFGKTLVNLQTETLQNHTHIFNRVCFPENVFSIDPSKQNKGGEQQLAFVRVICQENIVFLIDYKSELWAFGSSIEGQLGLRIAGLVYPVNLSQAMENKFKLVSSSQNFVAVYTLKQKLYVWGRVDDLGAEYSKVKRIEFSKTIDRRYEFQCADLTTFINGGDKKPEIITIQSTHNRLYILTSQFLQIMSPSPQLLLQKFIGLSCSLNHALAWDAEGKVWSWGLYSDGKLGYMNFTQTEQTYPQIVEDLKARIIMCACGINYSLALDVKGDVYGWGKGPFKIELLKATTPTKLMEKNKSFVKVVAGDEHFGALDMIGQFYVWGINNSNCLGKLPEEVLKPTLFDLGPIKVIDVGMGPFCTVLIVPSDRLHKVPNLNLDSFTIQQKKCFIEEASLIRDFTERRNRQTLMQMLTPTQSRKLIPDDKEYDKANELIHQMQLQLDSPRFKHTFNTTHGSHVHFDLSTRTMRSPISFDKVQNKLNKMENNNPLYLPILPRYQMTQTSRDDEINLDCLIQTEDDELKYRYIQLVKNNSEDQVLMQLLDEQIQRKPKSFNKIKMQVLKMKHSSEPQQQIKFNDKFDMLDPNLLENVKKELAEISKERWKQYLKKRKLRENKMNMLKTKFQRTKLEQISKEEQIESDRLQAVEKNVKVQYTILRKEEKLKSRLETLHNQLEENSTEFQIKRKHDVKKEVAKFFAFLQLLQYLNFESLCQMFEEASIRGLQKKRLQFQANNKAKIIQKAVRKRNIIRMINDKLGEKPRRILLSFIFRIRMQIRIKKRRAQFRKLNLYYQRNALCQKVRTNLNIMIKAAKNIQNFCVYHNKTIKVQLSYLNYKWDEYMKAEFKGAIIDKDKEEQKINQLQFLSERQVQIMKQLSYPFKPSKTLFKELQLIHKPKFKTDVLRINILKKVPSTQPQQAEEETKEIKTHFTNVLLPYTKYVENIVIPQNFRIRFDYQEIQLLNVLDKINQEEARLKLEILQTYQRIQRKNYIQQCRNYFQCLCDFKQKNKTLIGTERMKIMQKLSIDEMKQLKQKEEMEYRLMMTRRDVSMKRIRISDGVLKENIFEKIKTFQYDNYPFQMLTYKLVLYLSKLEPPKFQFDLPYKEWMRLFKNYHTDFKIRIQSIMSEARRAAAYKAKQIKRSTTIKSKSVQSKKLIDFI